MKRGEIWTLAGGPDYAGKPRPVVIVQSDAFEATASVTICPMTSADVGATLTRIDVSPDAGNGLRQASAIMVDKVSTVKRSKLGRRIGVLDAGSLNTVGVRLALFLGLDLL